MLMGAVGTSVQWTTPTLECNQYPDAASLENCPRCLIPQVKPSIPEVTALSKLAPLHGGGLARSAGTSLGLAIPPYLICPVFAQFFPLQLTQLLSPETALPHS